MILQRQYLEMSRAREVLTRAGVAKTFLQIPEIQRVSFTIEGQDLTDSRNRKVGDMTSDSFLDFSGGRYRQIPIRYLYPLLYR